MSGRKIGLTQEEIAEVLETEFLIPEEVLKQRGMERAEEALKRYESVEDFLKQTGWGRDNPDSSQEEYLTQNRICRWVKEEFFYFSRLIWEESEGSR